MGPIQPRLRSHRLWIDRSAELSIRYETPLFDQESPLLTALQEIRRIFSSRLETTTDKDGIITAVPAHASARPIHRGNQGYGPRRDGNRFSREAYKSFSQLGGEYLHCVLYKENKDTMDALNLIARMLKIKVQNFGFSGTKDRRAGTVQRISIYRQRAHNLVWLNSRMTGVKVGAFRHQKHPIQLGQHAGNEFIITLKNCQLYRGANCSLEVRIKMLREIVEMGLLHLYKHGFINYFGLQRFGTHSIGTHELGMKILKGNFEGAIEDILHVDPQAMCDMLTDTPHPSAHANDANRDEQNRARAIASWKATGNAETALSFLPKRFSAESSIIRHLGREGQRRDYMGALLSITKGMRQMYIHAYQSYIWNFVATHRWSKYGTRVIEGDLIIIDSPPPPNFGDDGDDLIDFSTDWENFYTQVRPLTAQDIKEGKYTIFDIVLPTPGFDVIYPENDIGRYYKTFMEREENGGLDPYNMRRRQKEFSLSGSYRPLIGQFLERPEYIIRAYSDDNEQMHPTDLDLVMQKKAAARNARKRAHEADDAALSSWKGFTENPAEHDQALDEHRRRYAEQLPPSDPQSIKQTWIQTSFDASGKRIKVARHQDVIDVPTDAATEVADQAMTANEAEGGAATVPGNSVYTSTRGDTLHKGGDEYLVSFLKNGVGADGSFVTPFMQPGSSIGGPAAVPSGGDSSFAKPYGASWNPQMPLEPVPPKPATNPSNLHGKSSGSNGPTTTAGFPGSGQPMCAPFALPSGEQLRCTIPVPEFQPISDNPILASAPGNHPDTRDYGEGKKIAVILKFQLRSSSYATIVLRELMGTIREENNRASRSTTPGTQGR